MESMLAQLFNEDEYLPVRHTKYRLYRCVLFMNRMSLFYVDHETDSEATHSESVDGTPTARFAVTITGITIANADGAL